MWNNVKVCPACKWDFKYDKDRDAFKVADYKYCPQCKAELETKPFSPDR